MKKVFKKGGILIILLLLGSISLLSQQVGTIVGRVIDSETGDPLRSATVSVMGTNKGAYTDAKGEFRIKDVPTGIYKLRITYIGYNTKEVADVAVEAGKVAEVSVTLKAQSIQTTDVVVEAVRTNDNAEAILTLRKSSIQVSDGISSEEIKRLSDSDAGQSLKRVSGITLLNDKFVYVRGVSERYSNTTLNGTSLATTEPDKKAFAFDMFPSEFLQNASVVKSFTPDLPGSFAGGLVQLNTVDFPHKFSLKVSISTSYSDNVTLRNRQFLTYNGGKRDWLGFDDGTRSLPSVVPSSTQEMRKLLAELKSSNEDVLKSATEKWLQIGKSFNNNVWKRDTITAPLNGSITLSYADIYNIFDSDLGVVASLMYNNSYTVDNVERGQLYATGDNYIYFGAGSQSVFSTTLGGMFNLSYKLNKDHSISIKNTYSNSSDDESTIIYGWKEQVQIKQLGFQFVQKSLYSGQLSGDHYIPLFNSSLDWKAGYSFSMRDEPDFRRIRYSRNDSTLPYRIDIYNLESNGYQAGRFFSNLKEKAYTASFNYLMNFDILKVKIGTLYELKDRAFNVRSFTINKSTLLVKQYYDPDFNMVVPNYGDEEFYDEKFYEEPEYLFRDENFSFERFGYSEETKPIDSYKATEGILAGYLMVDAPFRLNDQKFRLITGIRVENSSQLLKSYYPIGYNNSDSTFVNQNLVDFLPSINLIYELNKEMNLRFSASRTLTRPSLREYAPFTFYDFHYQCDVTGNPYLTRAIIQNYDIRWEWFPNPGEVISLSGFYKIFDNAIEETVIPTSSNVKRTYANATGTAFNYGAEIEFRKNLGFISSLLDNFMINMNLSLIKSEIRVKQVEEEEVRSMWGQSPYIFNIGLFYTNNNTGTTFNIGYNVYGRRIVQVADIVKYDMPNPHIYEEPRNLIDFTITQEITNSLELKFVAKDLLNEKLVWKQNKKTISSDLKGRTFSLNLSYKLQ